MKTRQKRCTECGGNFTYQWDYLGELDSDVCVECMLREMKEENKKEDRILSQVWLQTVKR